MANVAGPDDQDLSRLPNNIRRLRLERGLSLESLAKLIPGGMQINTLARLETGGSALTDTKMSRVAAGLSRGGADVHPLQLVKDAPGAPKLENMEVLAPEERALVVAIRRMPARERERVMAIVKLAAPEFFAAAP